jgi:hypothetical protein
VQDLRLVPVMNAQHPHERELRPPFDEANMYDPSHSLPHDRSIPSTDSGRHSYARAAMLEDEDVRTMFPQPQSVEAKYGSPYTSVVGLNDSDQEALVDTAVSSYYGSYTNNSFHGDDQLMDDRERLLFEEDMPMTISKRKYSGQAVFGAFVAGIILASAMGALVLAVVDTC